MERRKGGVSGMEGLGVGVADAGHDVPVVPGKAGKRERRPWSHSVEVALRVEHVGETEQVVLVGSPSVMEDEQASGLACRATLRWTRVTSAS